MTSFLGETALLSESGFNAISDALGVDVCSLWSLVTVETGGFGFFPDRRPKILFERHIFHKVTDGRFDASDPEVSAATAGGYSHGSAEYARLTHALGLDRGAAIASTSWGLGQIMGFNAVALGYASADAMVNAFCDSEDEQLDAVRRFIKRDERLHQALRSQDWKAVARQYNGPDFARNEYDEKLEYYFKSYRRDGVPNIAVRAAQARLLCLGYDPKGVDGINGQRTANALAAFQRDNGITPTGNLDSATADALASAAGF